VSDETEAKPASAIKTETDEDAATGGSSGGRVLVRILIGLATIVTTVAIISVWADRQVLQPDNWANTSSQLLQNDAIRGQTAQFLTDQIYANVDVQGEIKKALPTEAEILAGPAANALRGVVQDGISKALATGPVQDLWKTANRAVAQQAVNVIDEKQTGFLQFSGNDVKLDLRPAAIDLADRFGLASQAAKIPVGAAEVTVFSAKEIGQVRSAAKVLGGGALIFPLAALLLYAIAVAASPGRRRKTMIAVGWSLIVSALLVLVVRNVAKGVVVDAAVTNDSVRPAAEATWDISTAMLHDIAINMIGIAVVFLLALAVGGPRRPAVAIREWLAPWLKDKPGVVYGAAYGLVLLILIWSPVQATSELLPVLLLLILTGVGVWALGNQTAVEYPNASAAGQTETLRQAWEHARGVVGSGITRGAQGARSAASQVRDRVATSGQETQATEPLTPVSEQPTQPIAAVQVPDAATPESSAELRISELERLSSLHQSGALTDDEFAAEKKRLLAN